MKTLKELVDEDIIGIKDDNRLFDLSIKIIDKEDNNFILSKYFNSDIFNLKMVIINNDYDKPMFILNNILEEFGVDSDEILFNKTDFIFSNITNLNNLITSHFIDIKGLFNLDDYDINDSAHISLISLPLFFRIVLACNNEKLNEFKEFSSDLFNSLDKNSIDKWVSSKTDEYDDNLDENDLTNLFYSYTVLPFYNTYGYYKSPKELDSFLGNVIDKLLVNRNEKSNITFPEQMELADYVVKIDDLKRDIEQAKSFITLLENFIKSSEDEIVNIKSKFTPAMVIEYQDMENENIDI